MLIAALTAELPSHDAAAQDPPCTAIANDAERLACYDRALRATSPAPAAPAPTAPAPAPPSAPAAQTPAPAPAAPATATPSTQAPATQTKRDAEEIVPIVVVGVRALQGRETTFTTKDGGVWVQIDSQRIVGLPETPFDAEIKPGAMGSQFLVPKGGARAIRVRPVER